LFVASEKHRPSRVWLRDRLPAQALLGAAATAAASLRFRAAPFQAIVDSMKAAYGHTADGTPVDLYLLANADGMQVSITNYGGIVTSLLVPDRNGRRADVVLGFDRLDGYLDRHPKFGAICGRYANRIAKGRFTLNGVEYPLARNDGENHLHGGLHGFDRAVWKAVEESANAVRLEYLSRAGEEGYPGNLQVAVTYTLTADNALRLDYLATTDADTVLNLTHHGYFNLADGGAGSILGHEVTIPADRFAVAAPDLIPTGEIRSVRGTPMDFTLPTAIGARIDGSDEQLVRGRGYDHSFVLGDAPAQLRFAARLHDPMSGRVMEVHTTEPVVHFYTGNFLDGSITGKGGAVYRKRHGLCFECQHFPDSPNRPEFPTTVLKPGQRYTQTTVYRFSTSI
jgi:aldose 1-epimerase